MGIDAIDKIPSPISLGLGVLLGSVLLLKVDLLLFFSLFSLESKIILKKVIAGLGPGQTPNFT